MALAAGAIPRRILLVDDEEALTWSLSNRLRRMHPEIECECALDAETALEHLRQGTWELLLTDVRMPKMSGIELVLAARGRQPGLPAVVMTAYPSADVPTLNSVGAATVFLEKPFEFERLLGAIEQVMRSPFASGGPSLLTQTLTDILQLYLLGHTSGTLTVRHQGQVGRIWVERGALLHAQLGELEGEAAFFAITEWAGGDYSLGPLRRPPERTLLGEWQALLAESARRVRERSLRQAPLPGQEPRASWHGAPPSSGEVSYEPPSMLAPLPLLAAPPRGAAAHTGLARLQEVPGFLSASWFELSPWRPLEQLGPSLPEAAEQTVRRLLPLAAVLSTEASTEGLAATLEDGELLVRLERGSRTRGVALWLQRGESTLPIARAALRDVCQELGVRSTWPAP